MGYEETTIIDFDNDKDEDLLYFVNDVLYLKENLELYTNCNIGFEKTLNEWLIKIKNKE